jgi:hypothetical protein
MKVQVEIQPVARATTPTIGTARMTSLAGEKQPPALLAAGHDEQDAGRRVDDERPEDERRSGGEQQECGVDTKEYGSSWIFEPCLTWANALRRVQHPGFSLVSALPTRSERH